MSKSFTTIEQKMCLVTAKPFDSGALLIDKRLREKYEMHTITGWGFSPEVLEKFEEGYVALVGIDMKKSIFKNGTIQPEDAYRTGEIAYIREQVYKDMFDREDAPPLTFVPTEMMQELAAIPNVINLDE